MRILGIDPGKSTGYAVIKIVDGKKIEPTGEVGIDKNESLDGVRELIPTVEIVVIEDFKVRPKEARRGSFDYDNMVAPRQIGRIEEICHLHGIPFTKQQASLIPVAYGFANLKYQKGKRRIHWQDAYAHAVYYGVREKDASPLSGKSS